MGLDDLLHFDAPSYAQKISTLSTPDLQVREREKIRQFLSGSCSAGLGLGTAAATGGISLGFTALAGRNMQIANGKLDIIQAELCKRGVPIHDKLTGEDKLVPIMGGVVGMAVGGAVEGAFAADGGAAQQGGGELISPSNGDIIAANVVGGRAGSAMRWAMETALDPKDERYEEFKKSLGCGRLAGTGLKRHRIWCDVCGDKIERGMYARKLTYKLSLGMSLRCVLPGGRLSSIKKKKNMADVQQIAVSAMTVLISVSDVTKKTRNVPRRIQIIISSCDSSQSMDFAIKEWQGWTLTVDEERTACVTIASPKSSKAGFTVCTQKAHF